MGNTQAKPTFEKGFKKISQLCNSTYGMYTDYIFMLNTERTRIPESKKIEFLNAVLNLNHCIENALIENEKQLSIFQVKQLRGFITNLKNLHDSIRRFDIANSSREERKYFAQYLFKTDEISKICKFMEAGGDVEQEQEQEEISRPESRSKKMKISADEWTYKIDHYIKLEKIMKRSFFEIDKLIQEVHVVKNDYIQTLNILINKTNSILAKKNDFSLDKTDMSKLNELLTTLTALKKILESKIKDSANPPQAKTIITHAKKLREILDRNIIHDFEPTD